MVQEALFWLLAATSVVAAVAVIRLQDIFRAALMLVVVFLAVAGLFVLLSAEFLAVVQVLIYAGAIAVLILFAIMLTPRAARDNAEGMFWAPALVLAGLMATTISLIAVRTDWAISDRGPFSETAAVIGEALLDPFVLPFEVASALLVAAMIGAIVILREE